MSEQIELQNETSITISRDTMVWARNFYESIRHIKDYKTRWLCCEALFEYGLNNKMPSDDASSTILIIFDMAKKFIDTNNHRYSACKENGKKGAKYGKLGGRPKKQQEQNFVDNPKQNPKDNPKQNPKDNPLNVYEYVYVNDNVYINEEEDKSSLLVTSLFVDFPKTKIDIKNINLEKYDIKAIIEKIKESKYLQEQPLNFVFNNYKSVLADKYKDYAKVETQSKSKHNFTQREYTKNDLDALIDNLDQINLNESEVIDVD